MLHFQFQKVLTLEVLSLKVFNYNFNKRLLTFVF